MGALVSKKKSSSKDKTDVAETNITKEKVNPKAETPQEVPSPYSKIITDDDVENMIHVQKKAILILHGFVYDVTEFASSHPGGETEIVSRIGREMGDAFERIHSKSAKRSAEQYVIGKLPSAGEIPSYTAIRNKEKENKENQEDSENIFEATVLHMEEVAEGVNNITLSSPKPLLMQPGGHITVLVPSVSNTEIIREAHYTPFICEETSFTMTVKKYPNGRGSGYIHSLKMGDKIKYKGPIDPMWIAEKDECLQKEEEDKRNVLFIAGGVGITPIYTMVKHLLQNQISSVTLVVSYQTPEMMLLRKEIEILAKEYGETPSNSLTGNSNHRKTLQLHYIFTQSSNVESVPEAFKVHMGRFNGEMAKQLSPATSCIICGPPSFADAVIKVIVDAELCTLQQVNTL